MLKFVETINKDRMKKVIVLAAVVFCMSLTSCEKTELKDEISIETQATEQGDSTNAGGNPIDPTNDD